VSATIPLIASLSLEFIAGYAALGALRVSMPRTATIPLALLAGFFLHTVSFFVCALCNVPLTLTTLMLSAAVTAAAPHVWWKNVQENYKRLVQTPRWTLSMYDVVVLGVVGYIAFIATWASWYWPVTPFDAMAGIDLVAKQTVEEGTIVNRVFTDPSLAGQLSNQPFYAPFAMLMQVMYRLLGFEYGQVWVSIVAFGFATFVWSTLRQHVHAFIANILFVLYLLTPEMLGYSYLLQTDFLNAAFVVTAGILVWQGAEKKQPSLLWASTLFLAGACWSRSESILLVAIAVAASLPFIARAFTWRTTMIYAGVAGGVCLLVFMAWHVVFFNLYLPVHPYSGEQLIGFDISRFFDVVTTTITKVVADTGLWAGTFLIFVTLFVVNAVSTRKLQPIIPLIWIVCIMVGLWIVGTIFSAAIVEQTLRRGLFKVVPFLFIYMAGTELAQRASNRLTQWELGR